MNCNHCDSELGEHELPFYDGDGTTWCPQCYVWVAAPEGTSFRAIECRPCGIISVDVGTGCCGQCGKRVTMVLPQRVVAS